MKNITTTALTALLTIGAANAAVTSINFTEVDGDTGAADKGTFTVTTAASNGATSVAQFTVSDLDLTGDGSANDSFTFETIVTASGDAGTVQVNAGDYGHNGNGNNQINGIGELLTYNVQNTAVSFGDNNASLDSIDFNGFTAIWLDRAGNSEGFIYTDDGTQYLASGQKTLAAADLDGFTVSGIDTNANNRVRIGGADFSYTITAVPEPSSAALLGLGGIALILRRRK